MFRASQRKKAAAKCTAPDQVGQVFSTVEFGTVFMQHVRFVLISSSINKTHVAVAFVR